MYYIRLLVLLLSLTSLLFMVIGLVKPWIMLWWEDVQNRKKVLQLYGISGIVFLAAYYVMGFFV